MRELAKMHPEPKRLWLTALRSGDYYQIQGEYEDGGGGCCVGGVLWSVSPLRSDNWLLALLEWTGLDPEAWGLVVGMNDSGSTFPELADWIEKNL